MERHGHGQAENPDRRQQLGQGLALARRCLEEGAGVIIAGRGEAKLSAAREEFGRPGALETAVVDISREGEVAALFERPLAPRA